MQSTDEQKPVVEEQYDQILRLRRRLLVSTCVAAISTAAFLGVSILLGVTHLSDGSASFAARQEADRQRVVAAQNAQMSYQQALRAQQFAQQRAALAQQQAALAQQQGGMAQDGTGMMGAGSSAAGGFGAGGYGTESFGPGGSAASDEAPVEAPVPSTE